MAVPKTKVSKSKLRMRKAAWNSKVPRTAPTACPDCGAPRQPHRVCPSCGKYDGRQVLVVSDED
jgi:large subunit ribosomal protein L32